MASRGRCATRLTCRCAGRRKRSATRGTSTRKPAARTAPRIAAAPPAATRATAGRCRRPSPSCPRSKRGVTLEHALETTRARRACARTPRTRNTRGAADAAEQQEPLQPAKQTSTPRSTFRITIEWMVERCRMMGTAQMSHVWSEGVYGRRTLYCRSSYTCKAVWYECPAVYSFIKVFHFLLRHGGRCASYVASGAAAGTSTARGTCAVSRPQSSVVSVFDCQSSRRVAPRWPSRPPGPAVACAGAVIKRSTPRPRAGPPRRPPPSRRRRRAPLYFTFALVPRLASWRGTGLASSPPAAPVPTCVSGSDSQLVSPWWSLQHRIS